MILRGIKTGKKWDYGVVILTSEINENDIFKRIVDSGNKIESEALLIDTLKEYVATKDFERRKINIDFKLQGILNKIIHLY